MSILEILYHSTLFFEVLALVTGVLFYKNFVSNRAPLIIGFLAFIVTVETIPRIFSGDSLWFFNYTIPIEFSFYFLIFYTQLYSKNAKKAILIFAFVFWAFYFINEFYLQQHFSGIKTLSYSVGCMLIVATGFMYLYQTITSPIVSSIYKDLFFWISLGMLVFYCAELPIMNVLNMIKKNNTLVSKNLMAIKFSLSNFLYLCYCIGFVWNRK